MHKHESKCKHITQIFGYPETLHGEGKPRVGMKPINLHYYSNKVCMLRLRCLVTYGDLPYEGYGLLRAYKTYSMHLD